MGYGMDWKEKIEALLAAHPRVLINPTRRMLIAEAVYNKEAMVTKGGALATWNRPESTGRSPLDTVMVRRPENETEIDWESRYNIPISEETFDMAMSDAIDFLYEKPTIYVTDRVLGADPSYALPVRTIGNQALSLLFTDNMFRAVPSDIRKSIFLDKQFFLIVVPDEKLNPDRYVGRLRKLSNGKTTNMIVAMDFERCLGLIIGSAYHGSMKKLMFTVMNYLLPAHGILPLHCSATEGPDGDCALFLGLSGTGKTSLAADPKRALIGDDEHGWSNNGIANFENGCYAKVIDLSQAKEPEIYHAVMHEDDFLEHGTIVENAMVYPDGSFDFHDPRFTPNSRASFPLRYISNVKESATAGHPKTILFLTADANGVIPPISKLTVEQAMLWFLMGYTSKIEGTETGIVKPTSTFSRFFGAPFMPRNPSVYASMLGERLKRYGTKVYLLNTGWVGDTFGNVQRIDINLTRTMVHAALSGELENVQYELDPYFKVWVPHECPGVPPDMLSPRKLWKSQEDYEKNAKKLAAEFRSAFEQAYGSKDINPGIARECPE